MILNMISTGVMIKQGKVYENVMVDVMPTNSKLVDRACRIIEVATGVSESVASDTLEKSRYERCSCYYYVENRC